MRSLKFLPTILLKHFFRILYRLFTIIFPINPRKVTFASYRSASIEGNLLYLLNELKRSKKGYDHIVLFEKFPNNLMGNIKFIKYTVKALFHLTTSRYFVIDDFYLPLYFIKPRKGIEVIQVWHAAGAFKKFGYSTVGKEYGPSQDYLNIIRVHSNYSKVIVSTNEVIPIYAEAFNMPPSNIFPLGIPRTDYFFEVEKQHLVKERFYNEYPELKEKKLILYAPTFRGKNRQIHTFDYFFDFNVLNKMLHEEYVVLLHLHPYINNKILIEEKLSSFIYHIEKNYTIEELLILSDILITDYSSIIFDYSILCRPMAFFATDLDSYLKERDFYISYEEFCPGPIFKRTEELGHWIKSQNYNIEPIRKFKNRFLPDSDGNVSRRIVETIFK
ncbi:CDP-glycerol glycerophosphotransferase family protein [Fredinandcohnia sp. FSL W7-1320]|uniref:CDP-glycerol glycerophosphotransferase family protein n=1 Tax=Fredinandcohnia sp. FSL W7-1320 TaxID=2954540 RepID=UPI0030FD52E9